MTDRNQTLHDIAGELGRLAVDREGTAAGKIAHLCARGFAALAEDVNERQSTQSRRSGRASSDDKSTKT